MYQEQIFLVRYWNGLAMQQQPGAYQLLPLHFLQCALLGHGHIIITGKKLLIICMAAADSLEHSGNSDVLGYQQLPYMACVDGPSQVVKTELPCFMTSSWAQCSLRATHPDTLQSPILFKIKSSFEKRNLELRKGLGEKHMLNPALFTILRCVFFFPYDYILMFAAEQEYIYLVAASVFKIILSQSSFKKERHPSSGLV